MRLKPGYKHTDLGLIPEDWGVEQIGGVIRDFRGGAPLRPSDFTDAGVKVLPKGGVVKGGGFASQTPIANTAHRNMPTLTRAIRWTKPSRLLFSVTSCQVGQTSA
jgi:hypothetical protein